MHQVARPLQVQGYSDTDIVGLPTGPGVVFHGRFAGDSNITFTAAGAEFEITD